MAEVVFTDPDALRDLERILHPRVRGAIRARLAELGPGGVEVAAVEVIKPSSHRWRTAATRSGSSAATRPMRSPAWRRRAAWTRRPRAPGATASRRRRTRLAAADVVIDGSAPMEETRRQVERALATLTSG